MNRTPKKLQRLIRRLQRPKVEGLKGDKTFHPNPGDNEMLTVDDKDLLERLFAEADQYLGKVFELKNELRT